MRARNYISAAEWAARLDREMERVLRDPASFPEVTVLWARWRKQWLASQPTTPAKPARASGAAQYSLLAPLEERK